MAQDVPKQMNLKEIDAAELKAFFGPYRIAEIVKEGIDALAAISTGASR